MKPKVTLKAPSPHELKTWLRLLADLARAMPSATAKRKPVGPNSLFIHTCIDISHQCPSMMSPLGLRL